MPQDKKLFILVQFPDSDFMTDITSAFYCVLPVIQKYPVTDAEIIKRAIVDIASATSKIRSEHFKSNYGSEVRDHKEYIEKNLKVSFEEKISKDKLHWDVTTWYDPYTELIV